MLSAPECIATAVLASFLEKALSTLVSLAPCDAVDEEEARRSAAGVSTRVPRNTLG